MLQLVSNGDLVKYTNNKGKEIIGHITGHTKDNNGNTIWCIDNDWSHCVRSGEFEIIEGKYYPKKENKTQEIALTQEILLKIDDLIDDWASPAIHLGISAHKKEEIETRYANDEIFVEYYNGIKEGKSATEMRKICLPKYVFRELDNYIKNK